jgi:hypothetical protein
MIARHSPFIPSVFRFCFWIKPSSLKAQSNSRSPPPQKILPRAISPNAITIARFIGIRHTNIRWKAEKDICVFCIQISGVFISNLGQKIRNSQILPELAVAKFQQHSSATIKHISWTIVRMKAHEYPLEREWSPLYLFYSSLGLNPIPIAAMSNFLTAARSQVRLTSVSGLSFPGLTGRIEHCHLPFFFRSVWLSLFYHHDWKVGRDVLSVGAKVLLPSYGVARPCECA